MPAEVTPVNVVERCLPELVYTCLLLVASRE